MYVNYRLYNLKFRDIRVLLSCLVIGFVVVFVYSTESVKVCIGVVLLFISVVKEKKKKSPTLPTVGEGN